METLAAAAMSALFSIGLNTTRAAANALQNRTCSRHGTSDRCLRAISAAIRTHTLWG
jgi:hypothetical protein